MDRKKISRNVKRRLKVLAPFILIILGFCVISIGSYIYNIYSLKNEQRKLEEKLEELKEEEGDLTDEINKLKDPDYIAKYARENYYYTKNGEYVIKVNEDEEKTDMQVKIEQHKAYYIISLVVLLLIALIVFIRIKSYKKEKSK